MKKTLKEKINILAHAFSDNPERLTNSILWLLIEEGIAFLESAPLEPAPLEYAPDSYVTTENKTK